MVSYPSSSLEDCLTNVVSWTEFTGINWISLTSPNPVEHANNCPILKAYNECQKLRIYSFWRRRPNPGVVNKNAPKSPIITGKEAKELWIFWYENSEPPLIKEFLENGLIQDQSGSFASNGLDYKIRILMYDALHRILESGCIAKRFVRFGRWFCQPLLELITTRKKILPKYIIAFQFTFCTFGNQVCISPRFQRQPTLLSITKKHLLQKIRQKVILAPWGIVGHILPEQSHFDLDKSDPAENENEKSTEDKTNLLSSFGGLYSTPEKDKTATKKQLDEILKKYYEDFLFSVGYPDLPPVTSDLPQVLAIEIDGISTFWPTALMAICIDDLKDDDESEEEKDASDIEFIEPPSTSPSSYYAGCRAAQRLFEDALLPPPDRHDERLSLMDCTQKELCCCKSCNISEAPFDALPSISPAGILNPNTPHIPNPNTPHEPPSVPPTSIESVHSTSGDLKLLRRPPPRPRYKQPQFSFQLDYQKDRPKSPKIEAEVEEARRNDFAPTTSWAHATVAGEYPINHMGVNGGYTVALADPIYNVLPIFRGDQEWDETQAIQRPASPYTPITVVTPEYSQYNTDDESMTMEQERRDKPYGVSSTVREDDPAEPVAGQNGEHSILRSLLVSTDESSPTTPASDGRKSAASSSSYDSDSGLNERQRRNRKRANLGVTMDFVFDDSKRSRIYMSNLPMFDIGRMGVPKSEEYFEPGELDLPTYFDDEYYYYLEDQRGGNEDSDSHDEDDETPLQPNYGRRMNEQEIDRYAAPIERVPNPMALSSATTAGSMFPFQQQEPMVFDESFVSQPSTFENAMLLQNNDFMEVDNTTNDLYESLPSTSLQRSSTTVEGTKSLNEALRQAIKPITEIPENEEIAESTKRAMEAFQKRNPFPLSKKEKQKQQHEQEELFRNLISDDPDPIRALSRRTLNKVYIKIDEKIEPMYDMIDNIQEVLPNLDQYKIEGCGPMIQCKEFYGDPFRDNVRIQPNMFDAIDGRNARVENEPLRLPPKYIKKTNAKNNNTKIVEKINLQKAEEKEHALRYGMMQAAQNNFNQHQLQQQQHQQQQHQQQQQMQYHHPQQYQQQQQHRQAMFMNQRHHSFMSNSPQMNGMMFNNSIPPQTPSPMSTPRYMQPHSNTITVCGSNTGGSVQMADMGIGMNGFPGIGGGSGGGGPPPITSTPNSMMPYGPSPQMNSSSSFMPPYSMMSNGYNQPTPRMSSSDNLLMNAFDPIRIATPELSGLQMFEKIQKSVGFIFVALLRDSILDLHYDAVYDSCPLCSCTESIRTNEFGIYLSIPNDVQVADNLHSDEKTAEITAATRFGGFFVKNRDIEGCFCAFSAVRHRILCYANSNLFTDDIREATGGPVVVEVEKPELKWFNPLKSADWKFIDVFRWYLLGHDLSAYIRTGYYIGDCPSLDKIEEYDRLVSPKKEYIVNGIDQGELDYFVSSVFDASALGQMIMNERTSRQQPTDVNPRQQQPTLPELTSLVHPWAVQLADKTAQLNEIEYCGFMPKVVSILEDTAQLVRSPTTPGNIVEGPLTWKSLHQKATKMYKTLKFDTEEDTSHNPEPIPNIVVGSEKDLILTSPTAIWAWDRYGLAPYSWPKNVLYLTVIPDHSYATEKTKSFADNSLITEKCKIFMEDLSSVYEKNRLGRHLPLPSKVKDSSLPLNNGIIKIPLQNLNNSNDQKSLVQKLEYFVTQYLQLITRIFGEMDCFDKRTFLEAVYRDFYADHHSSAVPTDSSAMPPPTAIPSQQSLPNSTSSPMPPTSDPSFDSPLFNHQQTPQSLQQQQQNINSPLPNMFDAGLNPRTPDPNAPSGINANNNFGSDDPLSPTSISNGVDELMINDEENPALPHVLVIYIVNPFFFGSANTQEYFSKLVTVKLLKSFNNILANLDHIKKPRVQVELIDIRTIFDYSAYSNDPLQEYFHPLNQSTVNDPMASINALRKLAFTVYSQPRQLHVEGIRDLLSKSMTRFGPFSQATDILDNLAANPSSTYRIPTAPFILAPKSSNYEITPQGKLKLKNPDEKVLFVTYCLVKDDFLIVSVTDDRGELNDTKVISISRRTSQKSAQNQKYSSQVSLVVDAIQRLWAYIQGVMSLDTKNWRLVIGRFGKIGHGEFKAWTSILAKKNLQSYNSILKGKDKELQTPATDKPSILTASTSCKTCSLNPGFVETPALIAACLVSTEADAYFKIFPELLADQKQKGQRIIPNDYSITHIMVFPTSPCISSEVDAGIAEDKEEDFAFFAPDGDDNNTGMEMDLEIDINDLGEVSSATTTIANQPIAMGFMISTAPALDVPDWFWSQCPNAKNDTPVHLRSALHISVPHVQQNDDVMLAMAENHPLESNKTEEVLTYILQTYNELSWLNIDIISGQRKSCLPVHIQKLLVLYNSMNTTFY